jgi:hypothetical protein
MIKRQALDTDIDDLSGQLQHIRTQVELCDSARGQVKKELADMLEKQIARNYENLPAETEKYKNQLSSLSRQTGQALGQGVRDLQSIGLSFASYMGEELRKIIVDIADDARFKPQMAEFLKAYSDEINVQTKAIDFKSKKNELKKTERLKPESEESRAHVRGRIRRLLA